MPGELEKGQPEGESVQDRLAKLESELETRAREVETERRRAEMLSSKLTQAQQDLSESTKFLRSTLPDLRKVWEGKSFSDRWESDPELAVKSTAAEVAEPVEKDLAEIRKQQKATAAEVALSSLMVTNPTWSKYESRVRQLGNEYPKFTEDRSGIEKLFHLAEAEELRKSAGSLQEREKKVTSLEVAEGQKDRAYVEGSSPRAGSGGSTMTSEERRIARSLGVSEKDYVAFKNRGNSRDIESRGRPEGWASRHEEARRRNS